MTVTKLVFSNRHLAGSYTPTALDAVKTSENKLTSICGPYYTVITAAGELLEFKGARSFNKWAANNSYVTDF